MNTSLIVLQCYVELQSVLMTRNNYNSLEVYSREKNSSSIVDDIQQLTKYCERKRFNCSKWIILYQYYFIDMYSNFDMN